MEKPKPRSNSFVIHLVMVMCCYFVSSNNFVPNVVGAIESPHYTVVRSDPDFEIRLYNESSWMSALVRGTTSFENSTILGFHRLYQYIHGANLNSTRIRISAPVLTSNIASSEYYARLYLSSKYEKAPPQPNPELNLQLTKWKTQCLAVRNFSGFAKDDNIGSEVENLRNSLNTHLDIGKAVTLEDKSSFTIAQYNSSRHQTGRLNEVWMKILSGFTAEGCPPYQEGS
ncbi:hypothetical protein UlMin_040241 [Ulmus minor]